MLDINSDIAYGVVEMDETFVAEYINSLHSQFEKWVDKFNGISIEFLPNYIHWFKWLQCFKDDKDIIKSKNIIIHSTTNFVDTRIATYKGKKQISDNVIPYT